MFSLFLEHFSKRDIDGQKIKVKNTILFIIYPLGHMSVSAYISTIVISMYKVLYVIFKYISCILILLTVKLPSLLEGNVAKWPLTTAVCP